MITAIFLSLLIVGVTDFLKLFFSIIPDFNFLASVQPQLTSALSWFLGVINFMNPIVPSSVSLSIIGIYFSFYFIYFVAKFFSWILRKIPALSIS